MLEYALHFYNTYTSIFYIILFFAVIFEWPITILTLSIIAPTINISILSVYIFAFIWELLWDTFHYVVWRFYKKNFTKDKKFELFEKIESKIRDESIFEKLLVIKYTPPITSIWLFYLWFQRTNFKKFLLSITIFWLLNSLIITLIWYNFWVYFANQERLEYIVAWVMFWFLLLYLLIRLIRTYFIKNILNGK